MEDQIRQLRWRVAPERIDVSGSYVDRVVVTCPLGPEQLQVALGDPHVAPLIEAGTQVLSEPQAPLHPIAEIRQGQLHIGGRPRVTIMVIDHGEDLQTFKQLHVNTVWMRLRNDQDRGRLAALHEQGIFAAAEPPKESASAGRTALGHR